MLKYWLLQAKVRLSLSGINITYILLGFPCIYTGETVKCKEPSRTAVPELWLPARLPEPPPPRGKPLGAGAAAAGAHSSRLALLQHCSQKSFS